MTRYASGANAERELKAALELAYPGSLVIRSAGSHGPADLIIVNTKTTAIQVKSSKESSDVISCLSAAGKAIRKVRDDLPLEWIIATRICGEWRFWHPLGIEYTVPKDHPFTDAINKLRANRRKGVKRGA